VCRVIKPEDAVNRRKVIEKALEDLNPSLREEYRRFLEEIGEKEALENMYEEILRSIRLKRRPPKVGLD